MFVLTLPLFRLSLSHAEVGQRHFCCFLHHLCFAVGSKAEAILVNFVMVQVIGILVLLLCRGHLFNYTGLLSSARLLLMGAKADLYGPVPTCATVTGEAVAAVCESCHVFDRV